MLLCKPIATAVIEGTYYGDAQRDVEARQRARLEERSRMTALIRRNKKVVSYFSTLMAENKQQSQAAAQTAAQNSKSQHNSPAVRTPRNLEAVGDLRLMSRPPAPPPPPPPRLAAAARGGRIPPQTEWRAARICSCGSCKRVSCAAQHRSD